jgi:hypothetical protein
MTNLQTAVIVCHRINNYCSLLYVTMEAVVELESTVTESLAQHIGDGVLYSPKLAKALGGVSAEILLAYLWRKAQETAQQPLQLMRREIEEITGLNHFERERASQQLKQHQLLHYQPLSHDIEIIEFWLETERIRHFLTNLDNSEGRFNPPPPPAQPAQDPHFPIVRQPIAVRTSPHYQFEGPWESQSQFEAFQRELLEYFKQQGVPSPAAWTFKVVDGMSKGIISPFWDEFVQGIPLGSSQQVQREWEIAPGQPYPAFEEDRIQYYVQRGEPIEAATAKARRDLRNPVYAKDLWDGFLRKCDRVANDAAKAQQLGVQQPYLPPAFQVQTPVTKDQVMD